MNIDQHYGPTQQNFYVQIRFRRVLLSNMIMNNENNLQYIDLGLTRYKPTWDLQKQLVALRYENKILDTLLITEHHPVLTMGRGTNKNNLLVTPEILKQRGVDLHEIERGGDITFHGPGQTVFYPIINLKNRNNDVRQYLRDLEKFVILALSKFGLEASIKEGLTGIWVDNHKVGAIGVAVSHWVTYHGMALNINTNLDYFSLINPCGITEYSVGSVSQLLGREIKPLEINKILLESFVKIFGYDHIDEIKKIGDIFKTSPK
ncbi:MAG: lipoyl(octanoyl) transferase LipB [Candidatus Zixiibacteriota bacterium]